MVIANIHNSKWLTFLGVLVLLSLISFCEPVFAKSDGSLDAQECLDCHDDTTPSKFLSSPADIGELLGYSVHADADCIDCHIDITEIPHEDELSAVNCGTCHDDISDLFNASAHRVQLGDTISNILETPTCASCHGDHSILTPLDPDSKTSAKHLPYTCSECHNSGSLKSDPDIRVVNQYDHFMRGIHAAGLSNDADPSATCSDCHSVHDLRAASDPLSRVNKMNIPATCSTCHGAIYDKYSRGIHGKALAAGILDSPNCSDCHGEHEILGINDASSPVNSANLSDFVCGRCHNDAALAKKFDLNDERFTSYQDSYHGLALKGGSVKAANCVSCHNAHEILPQSNPASSIHLDNRTAMCAKCHPKSNATFASSYTHELSVPEQQSANNIVRNVYIVLIIVVISGMVIHNLIILGRYIREKRRRLKGSPNISRFNGNMVFQHATLAISFIVLAFTGFALRYPDWWWVEVLNHLGIFESERSIIHRVSALILIYVSLHHAAFIIFSKRGGRELRAFIPNLKDLSDVVLNIKYHLGLSPNKPRFAKFDYTEKAEYWAVVWGTVVMVITGFILWFPTFFTSFMPAWAVKISETIHLYEAWLATLAIGVFHLFFVIFHPNQYPMSLTWLNGKMSKEEAKDHHPIWYDQLQTEEAERVAAMKAMKVMKTSQQEVSKDEPHNMTDSNEPQPTKKDNNSDSITG